MAVMLFGMEMLFRPVQPARNESLMVVRPYWRVTLSKEVQPEKGMRPMVVTLPGMVMLSRSAQSLKA